MESINSLQLDATKSSGEKMSRKSERRKAAAKRTAAETAAAKQTAAATTTEKKELFSEFDEVTKAGLIADKREQEEEGKKRMDTYLAERRATQEAHATQKQETQAAARQPKPATQTEQWRTTQETLVIAQISRTTLHKATKAGTFPRPIKIGKKCVWIDSEIKQWMNNNRWKQ